MRSRIARDAAQTFAETLRPRITRLLDDLRATTANARAQLGALLRALRSNAPPAISALIQRVREPARRAWQTSLTICASHAGPAVRALQNGLADALTGAGKIADQARRLAPSSLALFAIVAFASVLALGGDSTRTDGAFIKSAAPFADADEHIASIPGAFIDRFTHLDETRWRVSDRGSNGWWTSNDFPRRNVNITREGLMMTMSRNPPGSVEPFSGAEISTFTPYTYGYFEIRMRAPRGNGLVTGFFTFDRPGGDDTWHEVDIEIIGRNTEAIELGRWYKGRSEGWRKPLWFDASDGFHTYGFEWTPDAVRWYVDNILIEENGADEQPIPHGPQTLFVNFWLSQRLNSWLGEVDPNEAPWQLTVACVAQSPRYTGRSLCAEAKRR